MKIKPYKEQIICLVLDFLEQEMGQTKIASTLKKKHLSSDLSDLIFQENLLLQKGLIKTVKNYVQNDKKVKEYYLKRMQKQKEEQKDKISQEEGQQQQQQIQEPKPKKQKKKNEQSKQKSRKVSVDSVKSKKKKEKSDEKDKKQQNKTWIANKFSAPMKLQQVDQNNHKTNHKMEEEKEQEISQEQEVIVKKKKKQKNGLKKKKVESSSQDSESETPIVKKPKKQIMKQKKQDKKEEKKKEKKIIIEERIQNGDKPIQKNSNRPFSRINKNEVGELRQELKDNTFEAKYKFGKGDEWGKYGYQKLKDTRGDSFKKTKGKLKNRAFQGANIDFNAVNSIPL